ncbi:MAG: ATP-binding protein [Candidatus Eremiobacteraeota bacterium]|nr:ATP-binding protein [Candidatus Eremiobacteraeota bacterium]
MAHIPQYRETFGCTPSDARRARKAIAQFAAAWLQGADSVDFETAVGEALANAIEHGKCSCLTVDCVYAHQRLVAEIAQNGLGFEPPRDRRAPERGSERGYGLFIMHSLLDRLEFYENGTRIRLVKRTPRRAKRAASPARPAQ